MAKNGLDKWFAQKWVDIGSKKKDGSFAKCGRSKQKADAKRKYPKCVPLAKARSMSEGQRRSAVARKRAARGGRMSPSSNKPNPKMNSMMKQAQRDYTGSFVSGSLGGVDVGNKSYKKFYSNPGYRMPKII